VSQVVARKPWTTRLGLGLFCALLPSACAHDVSLGENKPGSTDPSSNTMPPMVPSAAHGPGEDNEVEGDEGHSPEHEGQPESESDDEHGGADSDEDALGADGLEHDGHPANSADDNVDAHPEAPATSLLPESEHEVPVEHSDAGTLEQGADAEPIPPTDMATPLDLASHDLSLIHI
jgi:hypothetical protein